MSGHRPPRLLERLLEWALPSGLSGQGTLGDLAEGFEARAVDSANGARLWYAFQVVSVLLYRLVPGERGVSGRSDFGSDLRWSLRSLTRHTGFSLGVVTVLGLGLGANVAVYSVIDGTLRNTSWWSESDRTVAVWPGKGFSFGQLDLYQEMQTVYRSLGGYSELAFSLQTPDGESQSVNGAMITPMLFRELAVQPILGRALSDEDALFGVEPVVVIGDALWKRSFQSDPDILGKRIEVGGASLTVVGVQGVGGRAPGGRAELWLPLVMDPRDDDFWKAQGNTLIGVLQDGASLDDAFADLNALTDRLSQLFPMFFPAGFAEGLSSVARADETQRRTIATPLLLLLGGTGLLLLVTALNIGNLLLGRANERKKELAVRSALGASRGRIVAQLLVEGSLFTSLALALALYSGSIGGRWVAGLFVGEAVVGTSSVATPAVMLFALGSSLFAWLVLNGIPVAHFLRTQRKGLTLQPGSGAGVRRALVTVQAGLATLLLVSATLLVATVDNLRGVPLGFDPGGLLAVEMSPPEDRVGSPSAARELYDRLVMEVEGLPGVLAAGMTGWLPLQAEAPATPINLQAAPVDPAQAVWAPMHMVDPGFFRAFGVRATQGRLLNSTDRQDSPSAVVVNESLARLLWPDGSAVGQRVAIDPHAWDNWLPVVGVVPDIRSGAIAGPTQPALYVALAESPARDLTMVVRASGSVGPLASSVREAIRGVDALVPIRAIRDMKSVVKAAYSTAWVMMGLLLVLAVLASALGALGIYAVLTHHVSLNQREIGVRMALGAQPSELVGRVVRSGVALAGVGVIGGILAAIVSTRFLESLLFEVSALEPVAFLAPTAALLLAAGVAAWVPASRAGRMPPAEVLRGD